MRADAATVHVFPRRFEPGGEPWEPWRTKREVAAHFGVSERTVERWQLDRSFVESGCVRRLRGGQPRYRIGAIEAWHANF